MFTEHANQDRHQTSEGLVSIAQMARILQVSARSIRRRLKATPHNLPKTIQIPGSRNIYFLKKAVFAWLISNGLDELIIHCERHPVCRLTPMKENL